MRRPASTEHSAPCLPVQQFRNDLLRLVRLREQVTADDAFELMLLASRARGDGTLRARADGPLAWYSEQQLANWLDVSVKTFYTRWKRWSALKLVTARRPMNRRHPMQRTLAISTGNGRDQRLPVEEDGHYEVQSGTDAY